MLSDREFIDPIDDDEETEQKLDRKLIVAVTILSLVIIYYFWR